MNPGFESFKITSVYQTSVPILSYANQPESVVGREKHVANMCIAYVQYRCSSSTGLSIVLYGGATLQCLYTRHVLRVSVATKDWLHRGSILCPACDEICQV